MKYSLRSLMIVVAIVPPTVALVFYLGYWAWSELVLRLAEECIP
jgi:hypothetical protein